MQNFEEDSEFQACPTWLHTARLFAGQQGLSLFGA